MEMRLRVELIVIFWIGFGVLTAIAAKSKKRNEFGWLILGLLFGIFALAAVLILPAEVEDSADGRPTPATHNLCPDCNKLVLKSATVCPKCGCKLIAEVPVAGVSEPVKVGQPGHLEAITAVEKLAELRDRGLVSAEEYEVKKRQILGI